MYREIIKPTTQKYMIEIPKEYLNQEVEILVLPFYYKKIKHQNIDPMVELQTSSMQSTWDNCDDEAWNELKTLFCHSVF